MFHHIRWDVNKLFPLHLYLNAACFKLFEPIKILKWMLLHEFVSFVFDGGEREFRYGVNRLFMHCSAVSIHITSAEVWSLLVDRLPTLYNVRRPSLSRSHFLPSFIPSFSYANSIKKNTIFLKENGDGPNLYNSIWNKMFKNKNHKIIK